MTVAASRVSGAVLAVFALLTLTFLVLGIGDLTTTAGITKLGGWLGIATALAAWYASFAGVTTFAFKRPIVPTGNTLRTRRRCPLGQLPLPGTAT